MKTTTLFSEERNFFPTRFAKIFAALILFCSLGVLSLNAQTTQEFKNSTDTLVVYSDVPGATPSDKYTIRVKSAATGGVWKDVFTHYTYNRAFELEDILDDEGFEQPTTTQAYASFTSRWSHSYGNIEMSKNQTVEVEIAAKDTSTFKIGGKNFFKATVHPAQKASLATLVDGKIYFTINKPAQIVIDINGQMDDYNAAINPIGHPVHAISLFANPVIKKPKLNGSRVLAIEPGTTFESVNAIDPATYDTLYYKPGVHVLKRGILLHPGKTTYIPGDAIVYGSYTNVGAPVSPPYTKNGEKIRIYGYGTVSGAKILHKNYAYYYNDLGNDNNRRTFLLENGLNFSVEGLAFVDCAGLSTHDIGGSGGSYKWLKIITWRANGDGIGSYQLAEDCFIRTQDDCSYAKGNKKRCTFWKDANAALFHLATIPEDRAVIIEDCDVLYARLRDANGYNGGGFQQRSGGADGQRNVNVTFRNFRIHDKLINMQIFNLSSVTGGSSYKGLLFQNISIAGTSRKQLIQGNVTAPWNGGVIFENITINDTLLTSQNFSTFFNTNEYVKDIVVKAPGDDTLFYDIAVSASAGGSVSGGGTINKNKLITVTAVPEAGFGFLNWTENGVPVSTEKSYTFLVIQNRTLVANFVDASKLSKITTPSGWVAGTINNKVGGINRLMVVMVSGENATTTFSATGITYGGQPMTKQIDTSYAITPPAGAFTYTSIFTLNEAGVNAATSGQIVVTWSQTPSAGTDIQSVLLTNVDQNKPVYAVARGAATGKTLSTSAMSVTNGDMIIMSGANYNSGVITFHNDFKLRLKSNSGWGDAICGEKVVVSTTETPSFSQSSSGRMVLCAIAVKQTPSTSINNIVSKNDFSIYPNPATDKLFYNSTDKLISKIELVDLTGKIVHSVNVQLHKGSVDLKGIAKGLYLLKIHADNSIITKKISVK